ncbi:MAG: YckD family protein [bacterium]
MNRYLALGLAVLVLALAAVPALAATDTVSVDEGLATLYQEMVDLKKQILDRRVKLGQITEDQAEIAKDHIDEVYEWQKENGFQHGPGMGGGCCHGKPGADAGFGRGPARWGNGSGPGLGPDAPEPAVQS